jgi:hypothetical protein
MEAIMSVFEEYLYIDYENVQDVKIDVIKKAAKVRIIVGENQTKVPIDLVQKTQPFGNAVEWIQVSGKGRNALDFFISFFLGNDLASDSSKTFIIYSKDTGYDPLINYLKKNGIKAKRIVSFQELSHNKELKINETGIMKVKESLAKLSASKRPKKRSTLTGFITSHLNGTPKQEVDSIIDTLFIKKVVYEENGSIKYALD